MLTPQDVQDKQFTKAVFGGYDMATVDDFLETLSADYAALYKENAILKNKMKVLVDKVEEYRSTEEAMRVALKTAQKLSDDMIAEAKSKSESIIADAEAAAAERKAEINRGVEAEEKRLNVAREHTAEFVDMARELCRRHIEFLANLGRITPEVPESKPISEEQRISDTAKDIEDSLSKLADEPAGGGNESVTDFDTKPFAPLKTEQKEVNWDDVDEPTSPRPKFDFANLQFGSNYDNKGE